MLSAVAAATRGLEGPTVTLCIFFALLNPAENQQVNCQCINKCPELYKINSNIYMPLCELQECCLYSHCQLFHCCSMGSTCGKTIEIKTTEHTRCIFAKDAGHGGNQTWFSDQPSLLSDLSTPTTATSNSPKFCHHTPPPAPLLLPHQVNPLHQECSPAGSGLHKNALPYTSPQNCSLHYSFIPAGFAGFLLAMQVLETRYSLCRTYTRRA